MVPWFPPGPVDPGERETGAHSWLAADRAWYLVGISREGVMGEPDLAFCGQAQATAAAAKFGSRLVGWTGLAAALTRDRSPR